MFVTEGEMFLKTYVVVMEKPPRTEHRPIQGDVTWGGRGCVLNFLSGVAQGGAASQVKGGAKGLSKSDYSICST